jgi:hypothetical protein
MCCFKWGKRSKKHVPKEVDASEKVVRGVFAPKFIRKDGTIHTHAFRPNLNDEVSVLRLFYTTIEFCRTHFKKIEQPTYQKSYYGMAVLDAKKVYDSHAFFDDSQTVDLPMHTNIKFGIQIDKGKELPAEIRNKIDLLIQHARFYKDPNPTAQNWEGQVVV